MSNIALRAHFDGQKIVLDEPFDLEPDAELIVTVLPNSQETVAREEWFALATQMLGRAYGDDEPDYSKAEIKITNPNYDPKYEGR